MSLGSSGGSSGAMNTGLPASAAPLGGAGIPNVKVKFCRYYAKDKTCFYGEECQFLHEDPSMANLSLHGGGSSPVPLSMAGGGGTPAGYSLGGSAAACPGAAGTGVPKKSEALGPTATTLDGQLLTSEWHFTEALHEISGHDLTLGPSRALLKFRSGIR